MIKVIKWLQNLIIESQIVTRYQDRLEVADGERVPSARNVSKTAWNPRTNLVVTMRRRWYLETKYLGKSPSYEEVGRAAALDWLDTHWDGVARKQLI